MYLIKLTVYALSLLFLICQTVWAQNTNSTTPSSADLLSARILTYLDSIQFIRPGLGIEQVSIGMPLQAVIQLWGEPQSSERKGMFNRYWELIYKTDLNTYIVVTGDETVEKIDIQGNTGFQTPSGANFGMPQHQVRLLYGTPDESEPNQLVYENKGISFTFNRGLLYQIHIFTAKVDE